jgi:hypothetical protein
MRVAGSIRRAGVLASLAGLGLAGLTAPAAAAPAATLSSRPASRTLAGTSAGSSGQAGGAAVGAPAVPAGSSFVAAPRVAPPGARLKQVCPTPVSPGQMTCMALLPARNRGTTSASGPPSGAYGPPVLQEAYDLGDQAMTAPSGGTDTVAIVDAYNDPSAGGDLAIYRSRYGLPACAASSGCLTVVSQTGGTALPAADLTGAWELEESLDLDMVSAVCPYCKILLVEAKSDSISDLAAAEHYAAQHASAVSNSWGSGAEFVGENSFDADFYKPGVAITAAAGDDGYGTQYPAASPYVTAVGGTSLQGATATSAGHQTAWDGTGSGCSALEPKPSWQESEPGFPAGCQNRTEVDVSAVADPDPGIAIYDSVRYDSGSESATPDWTSVGGTSVGTPVVAAAYALADISTGRPGTGLVHGTMPAAYPYQHRPDFSDITAGSNGTCESSRQYLCHAVAGYDGPTGLGTPAGTGGLLGPAGTAVTVLDPGTQVYRAGTAVSLTVRSLDSAGGTAGYAATGLPSGLKMSGGVISGRLTGKAGVHEVTVTAAEGSAANGGAADGGATGAATFDIVVLARMADRHLAAGPVRLDLGGKCLNDASDSSARNTRVQIYTCDGRAAQKWTYHPGGDPAGAGELKIHGKCLTIRSGTGNGARATLQSCTDAASQRWQDQTGDQLYNPHSGRCLADSGSSRVNGRQVELWSCSGGPAQSWKLPAAPVLAGISGKCLADPDDSARSGTRIEISACSARSSQKWVMERAGTIRIQGKCLSVSGGSLADGAAAELTGCGSSLAQRWEPGPHGQLVSENSGRCLTAPQNAAAGGTKLTQSDCYGQPGQIWAVS